MELIKKMALELNYYELFLKKLNDFAFLISLKMNSDLGDPIYQGSFSKFQLINSVINKMLEKINENNNNLNDSLIKQNLTQDLRMSSISMGESISESDMKVMEMTHIDQFFNFECETKVLQNIKELVRNGYEKISLELENITMRHKGEYDKVPSKFNGNHQRVVELNLFLGKILFDKEEKIKKLNNQIKDFETYINNINANQDSHNSNESFEPMKGEESKRVRELLRTMEESINLTKLFR